MIEFIEQYWWLLLFVGSWIWVFWRRNRFLSSRGGYVCGVCGAQGCRLWRVTHPQPGERLKCFTCLKAYLQDAVYEDSWDRRQQLREGYGADWGISFGPLKGGRYWIPALPVDPSLGEKEKGVCGTMMMDSGEFYTGTRLVPDEERDWWMSLPLGS